MTVDIKTVKAIRRGPTTPTSIPCSQRYLEHDETNATATYSVVGVLTLYSSSLAEYSAEHRSLLEETVALLAAALSVENTPVTPPVSPQPLAAETLNSTGTTLASELAH